MGRSLPIGKIAGIRILIHWTFLLLLGWIVFTEIGRGSDTATVIATVFFVLSIFGCVLLHELGHSLTAQKYGIETQKITLLPIGGVASLERIPEEPKKELWVALAGPAVNVVIALLLYPFLAFNPFSGSSAFPTEGLTSVATFEGFVFSLFKINIWLVLFNAIPAFPMDGGRVLRAVLALKMDRARATRLAANLGQLIAGVFVFYGLFNNPMLVLIGIFVYFGAQTENVLVQHLELLKDYTVRNAMMTNFITLNPTDTVKDAADKLLAGSDQDLLVVNDGVVLGLMTKALIIDSLKEERQDWSVTEVMDRNFNAVALNDKLSQIYTDSQKKKNAFYPVIENNRLLGVIDMNNIQEFMMIRAAMHY